MDLIKETENKIQIAEKCIEMIKKADKLTDEMVWQLQFHKGYAMAMREVLSDLNDGERDNPSFRKQMRKAFGEES